MLVLLCHLIVVHVCFVCDSHVSSASSNRRSRFLEFATLSRSVSHGPGGLNISFTLQSLQNSIPASMQYDAPLNAMQYNEFLNHMQQISPFHETNGPKGTTKADTA